MLLWDYIEDLVTYHEAHCVVSNAFRSTIVAPRKDTSSLKSFKDKADAAPVKVSQDKTGFADFSNNDQKSVSSIGFNQCFGVVIATKKGALVGHYTCGDVGQNNAQTDLTNGWNANKNDKLKDPKVYIYAKLSVKNNNIQENEFENAPQLDKFKDIVKDLTGKDAKIVKYINVDDVITEIKDGKQEERDGFDQKTADVYSRYAGFHVSSGLLGPDVKFMTESMQKDSYKQ
jgi:hypothetical protein